MILLVNVCGEKLHEYEFVKPIEKLVGKCFVKKYDSVSEEDLKKAEKVIICGTALADNEYLGNLEKFEWLKSFDKPVLGVCAGCQILQAIFGDGQITIGSSSQMEIGQIFVEFEREFLGIEGRLKVYSLHQNVVESDGFDVFARSEKCVHAVKHKNRDVYGILFHPEVYGNEIIENFCKL